MYDYAVIIPHKNTPDLLSRCLSTIPLRNNIQIIVVDDHSDEQIIQSLMIFENKYSNLSLLYTKESRGAGYARNVGLESADAEWIIFADADDFFSKDAFDIFDNYVESLYDIIYFEPYSVYGDTMLPAMRHIYYKKLVDDFQENNPYTIDRLRYNFGVPWCKMISSRLIRENSICFDEILYSNDVMFSLKIGYYAKNIYAVSKSVYCVTVTRGSLVNRHSKISLECRYKVVLQQNSFLRSIGKPEYQKSIMHYLRLSLQYGLWTFFKFVKMAFNANANFFVGYESWLKSLFSLRWLNSSNKRYIIKE